MKDDNNDNLEVQFQKDFIIGCLVFLEIAAAVKGDTRSSDKILDDITNPIVGNRNPNNMMYVDVMPEVFKKVIDYCKDACIVDEQIQNEEMEMN